MNQKQPAFIVQSLDQARDALTATRAFSCVPLILSTMGYAAALWPAVFQAMIQALRQEFPDRPFTSAVDCGQAPGHAMAALRCDVEGLVIDGDEDAVERIRDMANQKNCMVYSPHIYEGEVLEMTSDQDMISVCDSFLSARYERNDA